MLFTVVSCSTSSNWDGGLRTRWSPVLEHWTKFVRSHEHLLALTNVLATKNLNENYFQWRKATMLADACRRMNMMELLDLVLANPGWLLRVGAALRPVRVAPDPVPDNAAVAVIAFGMISRQKRRTRGQNREKDSLTNEKNSRPVFLPAQWHWQWSSNRAPRTCWGHVHHSHSDDWLSNILRLSNIIYHLKLPHRTLWKMWLQNKLS